MTLDQAITLMEGMLKIALLVGTPVLLAAFVVGLLVSIFQAATQIHEMTLTFIPKIIAVIAVLIVFGSWMITKLSDYIHEIFDTLVTMLR